MPKRSAHTDSKRLNAKGAKIRALREGLAVSQAEVTRRLQIQGWDCDPMVYNRIELGKHTLTDLEIEHILTALRKKWADLDE